MKTIKLFIIALVFFAWNSTQAQVSVNVNVGTPNVNANISIGKPPVWGPVGYDEVEYYYLPDIEVYYDIRQTQYIYFGNGKWIRSRYLPSRWRNYDLYHGYKVVLTDYHGHSPYTNFNTHKVKYYKGYKGAPQQNRGEYKVRYENHDNGNHNQGNHEDHKDKHKDHEGKGHNGKGKH